jgi:hypothetical protein
MNRSRLDLVLVVLSAALLLCLSVTGGIMHWVLPPGSGQRLSLWGWGRHDFGGLHFWLSVGLMALIVVHVAVNWAWTCAVVRALFSRESKPLTPRVRLLLGMAALAVWCVVVGVLLWWANGSVAGSDNGRSEHGFHGGSKDPERESSAEASAAADGNQIRGSMTMQQLSQENGIPLLRLKAILGLPDSVPSDERLGHLVNRYDLNMADVRETIRRESARPGNR